MLDNGEVRVFSRNLEDNTTKYPDIVTTFKAHLKPGVRSVVLDAEAVAYDRETKKILPFQVLSTRAKKGVSAEDVKVQARSPAAARAGMRYWSAHDCLLTMHRLPGVPLRLRLPLCRWPHAPARASVRAPPPALRVLQRN